jgi:hypothetical protein
MEPIFNYSVICVYVLNMGNSDGTLLNVSYTLSSLWVSGWTRNIVWHLDEHSSRLFLYDMNGHDD